MLACGDPEWPLLLLAATVWSFVHLPLGPPIATLYNKEVIPTFLWLRSTSWVPTNVKGNQFDTHLWNKIIAQLIFNYGIINNIHDIFLCKGTDHVNYFQNRLAGELVTPGIKIGMLYESSHKTL